jgi:peptidyl-dipeptidase Dcp
MRMSISSDNPFALPSSLEYALPPFAEIEDKHYLPAFYEGTLRQLEEVDAILANEEIINFENTIVPLEKSGQLLNRMLSVFYNKSSSDTSPAIDEIEAEFAPKLAAHQDAIKLNPILFERVRNLYDARDSLNLNEEDNWILVRYYKDFIFAGAHLASEEREILKGINEDLARLETVFSKKLLNDTNDLAVIVDDLTQLDGLNPNEIEAASNAAQERGLSGKWLLGMVNFTGNPLLSGLKNRQLRQRIMEASMQKGNRSNANDSKSTLLEMATLRAKRAQLFGFENHAQYVLTERTAGKPENVHKMLRQIAPASVKNARAEGAELQAEILASGEDFQLQSWDWDFYTEKVRPYFELERVLHDGVFFAAEKLFGLTFSERADLTAYHPKARTFEVFNEDKSALGLFIADFYTRDSKRGGAWMNNLVDQNFLLEQLPVVVNNLNIPKPAVGEPTLLTLDEVTTLFHEFGHALHGLLSSVKYPRLSGANVPRDFVEFPSQVNEMWIMWPEVLENYARHYQTGEHLPQEWVKRLDEAKTFNEGHATTSYLESAVLDLAWHSLSADEVVTDVIDFEDKAIANYGLNYPEVPTRYRSTYFSHIFAGGYSAGYYGYIWSEILDADTVEWFKANGGLTRANGDHFRKELLSRGGSVESLQMFRNFRGRDALIEPLLKRRGLI